MNELRDKRKNAGQIFYNRMDELRENFPPCDLGEIILAAWDYEQFGVEYDFAHDSKAAELYPNIAEDRGMLVEYKNLVRDFKILSESYNESCNRKRDNANKRWEREKMRKSQTDSTEDDYSFENDISDIAKQYKDMGVKSVRELKHILEEANIHDADRKAAIIEAFSQFG